MQNPTEERYSVLMHTVAYVTSTIDKGILLQGSDAFHLHAYSDLD